MVVPYISREDIRAVLDSLIHTTRRRKATGLHGLLLVDLTLTAPEMPAGDEARDYAVHDLLVSEITRVLDEQRALFQLSALNLRASAEDVRSEIAEMVKIGARELLSWSTLYYRYVRSDLGLSVDALARLLAVHPRTMPRYHEDALDMLTQRVIKAEQYARRARLQRYLLASLPYSVPVRLFGRQDILEATAQRLVTLSPRHILITGTAGIGKTAFAQELLRRQVIAGELDYLIWLDQPSSADYVRQQAIERLFRENSQVTLRDFLLLYRVAIVLDGLELLTAERTALGALLSDFGAAEVLLVNRTPLALEAVELHIALPELDFAASTAFVEEMLRAQNIALASATARVIYSHVGGTPLALRLAATLWEQGHDWNALQTEVQERLLERLYLTFDAATQRAWCALALFPGHVQFTELLKILKQPERSIRRLKQHGLVVEAEDDEDASKATYALIGAAREYIRQQATAAETAAAFLESLDSDSAALDIIEYALESGFPRFTAERRSRWIKKLWKDGLRRGHWARWRQILENAAPDDESVELRIAYGVCMRRLNEWESAEQVFYSIVNECGRGGRFAEQAEALLEWSILARYQGKYERAQGFLAQARRYAERVRNEDLLRAVALQSVQILLEEGKGAEAQKLLVSLPETAQALALASEVQFRSGNYEACRTLAQRALALSAADLSALASLSSLIGRSFQAQGDLLQARAYMSETISLLERLNDTFALARAKTNLAGILLPLGQLADAGRLLASAEDLQGRLGDRVGLSATRHNLALLGDHIAR